MIPRHQTVTAASIHRRHYLMKGFKWPAATQNCCQVSSPLLRHLAHSITVTGSARSKSVNNIKDCRKRGGERKPLLTEREKEDVKAQSDRNRLWGKKTQPKQEKVGGALKAKSQRKRPHRIKSWHRSRLKVK
jgi:hypothetical protein